MVLWPRPQRRRPGPMSTLPWQNDAFFRQMALWPRPQRRRPGPTSRNTWVWGPDDHFLPVNPGSFPANVAPPIFAKTITASWHRATHLATFGKILTQCPPKASRASRMCPSGRFVSVLKGGVIILWFLRVKLASWPVRAQPGPAEEDRPPRLRR